MNDHFDWNEWRHEEEKNRTSERAIEMTNTERTENLEIRKLLWLRHGCPISALYGDDGEMQCGICLVDFKRDNAEDIAKKFTRANWKAPVPQLKETFPCVVYFESCADANEFIQMALAANPSLKSESLQ